MREWAARGVSPETSFFEPMGDNGSSSVNDCPWQGRFSAPAVTHPSDPSIRCRPCDGCLALRGLSHGSLLCAQPSGPCTIERLLSALRASFPSHVHSVVTVYAQALAPGFLVSLLPLWVAPIVDDPFEDGSLREATRHAPAFVGDTIFQGEAVVVRSSRSGRRVQEQATRIEVIDREEVEEKLLMRPGSIAMLLAETGGVQLQSTSSTLGGSTVRIQGMPGRYTLLLADGLPLYGSQPGGLGVLQIPPMDLEEVEVIRGVASALHGGQALGGVINLVSRRPGEEPLAEFLLNATSRGGQDLIGYGEQRLGRAWSASVTGGVHRQGIRDLDGSGWSDIPGFDRETLRLRMFRQGDPGTHTYWTLGGMRENRRGGSLPGQILASGEAFEDAIDADRIDGGFHLRRPLDLENTPLGTLASFAFWDLRGSFMEGNLTRRFGPREEANAQARSTRGLRSTRFLEGSLSGIRGAHTWVMGVALQDDRLVQRDVPAPFIPLDFRHTVPGFFLQDEVRLNDQGLTVSGSLRVDRHNLMGVQTSPRFSLLLPQDGWDLRVSLGAGYFAPTPLLDEVEASGMIGLRSSASLQAEQGVGGGVDLTGRLGFFDWSASLFSTRVDDEARLRALEEGGYLIENRLGRHTIHGSELRLRARFDDVSITGSYLFVQARRPGETESAPRSPTALTPRHSLGLVAVWEDHDRGLLGLELYHTGRQVLDDNPWRAEGRSWLHAGILGELRMEGWSVFLNMENLLGVRQTRWDPLLRPSPDALGLRVTEAWAPLEGFTLNAGIRIRLGGRDPHHHEDHDHHH